MAEDLHELMTVKETAEYLRIPLPTVYYLVQRGQLPAVQIGGRWRIKRSLLDRDVLRNDQAGQPTVLVVDDDLQLQNIFKQFLKKAGFGRIENRCAMPATIVSASSPAYASVELHESKRVDGVNRMREVPELRIAPDGAAVLQPGGLHLMLIKPNATLKPGSRVAIEFVLKDGRKLLGEFEVRKPAP